MKNGKVKHGYGLKDNNVVSFVCVGDSISKLDNENGQYCVRDFSPMYAWSGGQPYHK